MTLRSHYLSPLPPDFVFPATAADLDEGSSVVRRFKRAAFARQMALDGRPKDEIAETCSMTPRSLDRVLACLSFADAPYPPNWTRRMFASRMKETGYVAECEGHEDS